MPFSLADPFLWGFLFCVAFFSFFAHSSRSLNPPGIALGVLIGLFAYWKLDWPGFLAFLLFFVLGDLATRLQAGKEKRVHETRGIENVLGNTLAAVTALALNFPLGFFAGIAAALSDTLSSEVGMLSKRKPRLLTTLEHVEKGTDGGITLLGLAASALGAGAIAGIAYYVFPQPAVFLVVFLAGILGSLADSFFGAVWERNQKLDNTLVNLLGTSSAVLFAWALFALL